MALDDAIRALGRSALSHRVPLLCFTGFSLAGMTITQSEVDEHLAMLVLVFADFNQGIVGLGQVEIEGHTSFSGDVLLSRQPKKVALNARDILERWAIGPRLRPRPAEQRVARSPIPGNNFSCPGKNA